MWILPMLNEKKKDKENEREMESDEDEKKRLVDWCTSLVARICLDATNYMLKDEQIVSR